MPTGTRGTGPVAPGNMTGQLYQQQQRTRRAQINRERELAERDTAEAEVYLSSLTQGGELTPVHDPVSQGILYFIDRAGNEVPA